MSKITQNEFKDGIVAFTAEKENLDRKLWVAAGILLHKYPNKKDKILNKVKCIQGVLEGSKLTDQEQAKFISDICNTEIINDDNHSCNESNKDDWDEEVKSQKQVSTHSNGVANRRESKAQLKIESQDSSYSGEESEYSEDSSTVPMTNLNTRPLKPEIMEKCCIWNSECTSDSLVTSSMACKHKFHMECMIKFLNFHMVGEMFDQPLCPKDKCNK